VEADGGRKRSRKGSRYHRSSGLGEATAQRLASEGVAVVLGARRKERIEALVRELGARGGKVIALVTDVTDQAQVKHLIDAAVHCYGRIDVMLNDAGLMPQALLEKLQIDEWNRMIDVNLKGVLYGIVALPYMVKQRSGHFIQVSSVAGHKVGPSFAVHAATNFGVRPLRRASSRGEAVHPMRADSGNCLALL
jgi:NADP-dependent 3-hydroxy acid dehydrogenase YdfG